MTHHNTQDIEEVEIRTVTEVVVEAGVRNVIEETDATGREVLVYHQKESSLAGETVKSCPVDDMKVRSVILAPEQMIKRQKDLTTNHVVEKARLTLHPTLAAAHRLHPRATVVIAVNK